MPGVTFARKVTKWEVTTKAVANNSADLQSLEQDRLELEILLAEVMDLGNEQIATEARLNQINLDLREKLQRGDALAARLRAGVRAKYGYKSEKLTEFQLRPFRRRVRGSDEDDETKDSAASRF